MTKKKGGKEIIHGEVIQQQKTNRWFVEDSAQVTMRVSSQLNLYWPLFSTARVQITILSYLQLYLLEATMRFNLQLLNRMGRGLLKVISVVLQFKYSYQRLLVLIYYIDMKHHRVSLWEDVRCIKSLMESPFMPHSCVITCPEDSTDQTSLQVLYILLLGCIWMI